MEVIDGANGSPGSKESKTFIFRPIPAIFPAKTTTYPKSSSTYSVDIQMSFPLRKTAKMVFFEDIISTAG